MKNFLNKNVLLLTQGQFISFLGDAIFDFSMGVWIYAITDSTFLMGLTMASLSIPYLLLSPVAGYVADKYNKKTLIVLADLIRGLLCFFMMMYIWIFGFNIIVVLFCSIAIGCISPFFSITINSLPPLIVENNDIIKVNSLFSISTSLSNIIGRSIAAFLYYYKGIEFILLINAISFVITGVLEMFIKLEDNIKDKKINKVGFLSPYKIAFERVKEYKGLSTIISYIAIFIFLYQISITLIIVLFNQDTNLGVLWLGIVSAALMIGMLCISLFLIVVKISNDILYKILIIGGRASFFIILPFAFIKNIYWLVIVAFIFGVNFNLIVTTLQTTIQNSVSKDSLGKIMGLMVLVTQGISPIGTFVAGIIGEFGHIEILLTVILLIILISFWLFTNKLKLIKLVKEENI